MQHDTAGLLAKQLMWPEKRNPLKNVNFHKKQQGKSKQKINIKKQEFKAELSTWLKATKIQVYTQYLCIFVSEYLCRVLLRVIMFRYLHNTPTIWVERQFGDRDHLISVR